MKLVLALAALGLALASTPAASAGHLECDGNPTLAPVLALVCGHHLFADEVYEAVEDCTDGQIMPQPPQHLC